MTDLELMQSIKTKFGDLIAAAAGGDFPQSFLAALIDGESAGNPNAKRFEPRVLSALWEVLMGRKPAYGSITTKDLVGYVSGVLNPVTVPRTIPSDAFNRFDHLATSYGLTQIMGWHDAFQFGVPDSESQLDPQILLDDPAKNLSTARGLLGQFATQFNLDSGKDFEQLFRCWNSGRPDGQTFDPNYAANGLARMKLYDSLLDAAAPAPGPQAPTA